jgi:hypothetical protein
MSRILFEALSFLERLAARGLIKVKAKVIIYSIYDA